MENTLLRFCRDMYKYTPTAVARKLRIDTNTYLRIEQGEVMLTNEQAKLLGKLYKADGDYFYAAGLQLDMLLTMKKVVNNWSDLSTERKIRKRGTFK